MKKAAIDKLRAKCNYIVVGASGEILGHFRTLMSAKRWWDNCSSSHVVEVGEGYESAAA